MKGPRAIWDTLYEDKDLRVNNDFVAVFNAQVDNAYEEVILERKFGENIRYRPNYLDGTGTRF